MKPNALLLLLLLLFAQTPGAQNYKNWQTHLACHEATGIAETNDRIYVLANGSLYSYGKTDAQIRLHSKQTGLSDSDIRLIKYNPDNQTLLIVYQNGNLDLLNKDGIRNMPDLKNNPNIQSKTINDIYLHGNLAYLSADFGLMALNTTRKEVLDTYKTAAPARSACILNDTLYLVTQTGLIKGHLKDNLLDRNNWQDKNLPAAEFDTPEIKRLCLFRNKLIYCVPGKGIYYETDGQLIALNRQADINNITVQNDELLAYTAAYLYIYRNTEDYLYLNLETIHDVASLKNDGKYWIAAGLNGLIGIAKNNDNTFAKILSDIVINSPKRNYNNFMTILNGRKLLITGGDRTYDRLLRPGTFMTLENGQWHNFDESVANREILQRIGSHSWDYMGVAADPDDENHYYIATYGEGLIELKNDAFVNLHNADNSTLRSAVTYIEDGQEKQSPNYLRIGSVCFDSHKNLWLTNCLVNNSIHILTPQGKWIALYYPEIRNADKIDKILIRTNGHKWINIPDDGIFVLDDNGTIEDSSDDKSNFFRTFRDAQSNVGASIGASQYLAMAEDQSGVMWIGTNIGLLKCSTPTQATTDPNLSCSRPVRDGEAYFLFGESVTAIAVDADNQKWIGTATQGVFLINEDGSETIHNFKTDNSPLLSNTIKSIAVNRETGEVYFGTDNGLVSYSSGVKSGVAPFSDVYAYPNPVRPEHTDKVTITGLTNRANVKITDINGNLIYQGRAVGNQLVWNCRTGAGVRVATGVYIVLATTPTATESVVTKIAIVK